MGRGEGHERFGAGRALVEHRLGRDERDRGVADGGHVAAVADAGRSHFEPYHLRVELQPVMNLQSNTRE